MKTSSSKKWLENADKPQRNDIPGPLVLWAWNNHAVEKAQAVLEIAAQIPDVMIIPMPDYRPKYPKSIRKRSSILITPNLTIWGTRSKRASLSVCIATMPISPSR